MRYICMICGYVYDDAKEKVPFESLPASWKCPLCGAAKSDFKPEAIPEAKPAAKAEPASQPAKVAPAPAPTKSAPEVAVCVRQNFLFSLFRLFRFVLSFCSY